MKRMHYRTKDRTAWEPDGETWRGVHLKTECRLDNCVVHNPSDHSMVNFPRHLRETGLVERICPHGVGHPDPDSAMYLNTFGPEGGRGYWGIHGCDGCCAEGNDGKKTKEGVCLD